MGSLHLIAGWEGSICRMLRDMEAKRVKIHFLQEIARRHGNGLGVRSELERDLVGCGI